MDTINIAETPSPSKGHPKGLYVLFTTEMWERFNFYGMRALLTLFLVNALAFREAEASVIYGGFLGLCYLTPMLGGFISDRFLGNRNCILLGGVTMGIGQLFLFLSGSTYDTNFELSKIAMYVALGVIILGNGFFKPNISSMVGQLYPKGDSRLDAAFTIFYMGINVGAFLGMNICSMVGDVVLDNGTRIVTSFKWGFLSASMAMFLGSLVFYFLKNKYIVSPDGSAVGGKPALDITKGADEVQEASFSVASKYGAFAAFFALVLVFRFVIDQNWIYAFIYASGLSLAGFIITDKSLTAVERDRILVIYILGFFVIFFWACFEQAGSSLTFIADNQTDRRLFGWNMPPSIVQNANSLFIMIFAFPFSWLWLRLQRRNLEPISPVKQSIGLLLLSFGFLIIAFQVKNLGNTEKLAVIWLIVMYLFHTLGELCLSPIGLSLVSKLAPHRFSSLLMGVWFLANAAGYALAGTLGASIPPTGEKFTAAQEAGINLQSVLDKTITPTAAQLAKLKELRIPTEYPTFAGFTIHNLFEFFMLFVILPGVAAVLLFLLSGKLRKMMHGIR
ncbi:POT family proton-dependent oligopeptide transporter [Arcticibacter tournemirensis]|uniref:MFS transporter n=1 Tax=Arcticibacter tournemirensis TaxID=699437 RepID=A0A4Q0M912_9SPHI|nr:peptide MFS transporter [Arcticibacter tournemirensis]KAA8483824.1 peptide MFS transporter [Arcticibacter tournemirensis]RXF69678.1 MFS transporter [Arcticibacter tournemirensis]TQM49966.1 POT family proton-dependent oligopeptide transporter [Arcticibacter tournemirensis]